MEDADKPDRLTGLDSVRHDVLDLEIDRVADADAVLQAVVLVRDRCALDPEEIADQRSEELRRAAELSSEDNLKLLRCSSVALSSNVSAAPATFELLDRG